MKIMMKKVYNVGVNDYVGLVTSNGVKIRSYSTWKSMLMRCYSDKYQIKHPAYIGCIVCAEWLYFSNFKRWFDKNYIDGYELDKDIVGGKGNKIYSPETCCFVPQEINKMLVCPPKRKNDLPQGIVKPKNRKGYNVYLSKYKEGVVFLGYFLEKEKALSIYNKEKEKYVHNIAEQYFLKGYITTQVYNALKVYKVKPKNDKQEENEK
jgi:hypothetical protein